MKMNDKKSFTPFILVLGLVLIAVAVYMLVSTINAVGDREQIEGVITSVEKTQDDEGKDVYTVYVKFTVDGQEYTGKLNEYVYGMKKDAPVSLMYKVGDPTDFVYGTKNYLPSILFMICGVVIVVFAVVPLIGEPYKKKLRRLKAQSRPIEATIKEFSVNRGAKSGGKFPANLVCGDYQGKTYRVKFKVDRPESFYVGSRINVYVDRENPDKYIVDTEDYLNKRR